MSEQEKLICTCGKEFIGYTAFRYHIIRADVKTYHGLSLLDDQPSEPQSLTAVASGEN